LACFGKLQSCSASFDGNAVASNWSLTLCPFTHRSVAEHQSRFVGANDGSTRRLSPASNDMQPRIGSYDLLGQLRENLGVNAPPVKLHCG
jgi:hypothetical protein